MNWFWVETKFKSTIECKIKNFLYKKGRKNIFSYESFGKFNQNSCELEWMMEHGLMIMTENPTQNFLLRPFFPQFST